MKRAAFVIFVVLTGCFQAGSDDEDLRTVPVTNNPYVIPSHGGGLPGMSSPAAGGPH